MRSNSVIESFFGTLQLEPLDRHEWKTRKELALAIYEYIEAWSTRAAVTATATC